MNVLLFNAGADTGGVLSSIVRAFRGVPGWTVRSLVSSTNYIRYPMDLQWTRPIISKHWLEADVIHLHHDFRSAELMRRGYTGQKLPQRPYVLEFHGTGFREQPFTHLREMRANRALGVVSTLDLYLLAPRELEWLPAAVDSKEIAKLRQPRDDGRVRIAHAPTNRGIKSTEAFVAAIKRLKKEGYPVDLDLIEHQPWAKCLERKAQADIYFDQVILGYGCNAIEAWGMGIPVVAGGADPTLDEMERRFGGLPFYHATQETIYDALRELVESPALRQRYGQRGLQHVQTYHDDAKVVEQLKGLYQRAAESRRRAA